MLLTLITRGPYTGFFRSRGSCKFDETQHGFSLWLLNQKIINIDLLHYEKQKYMKYKILYCRLVQAAPAVQSKVARADMKRIRVYLAMMNTHYPFPSCIE